MIDTELYLSALETVNLLKEYGYTLSVAESCTGGMASSYLTEVSGVSQVFSLGVTSYTCKIKNEVLGVSAETLEKYGAVSWQTASQMAENVLKMADSDVAVSVTGVAGPDSSEGHPVGYVFIAVTGKNGTVTKLLNIKPLDRNYVRKQAVLELFEIIRKYVKELKNAS